MKGSLSEVIKRKEEEKPIGDLDLPDNPIKETIRSEVIKEESDKIDITFTNLSQWFPENIKNFPNLKQVKISIQGIDARKTLIYTEPDPKPNDSSNRKLQVIPNSNEIPVLDLPGFLFDTYFSGFRVLHKLENLILKSYIVKTGMYVTHCVIVDEITIPIKIEKIKKKSEGISLVGSNVEELATTLKLNPNLENIQLKYNQIQKYVGDLKTVRDTIQWMLKRQEAVHDINHHLLLDELMISLF